MDNNSIKKVINKNNIWVSSDSEEILKISKKNNVNFIIRPSSLSKDNSTSEDAWLHAINEIEKKKKLTLY